MTFLTLSLPPGIVRDATAGQSRGRWRKGNLARGYGCDVGPVLGWRRRANAQVTGAGRTLHIWDEDYSTRRIGIGTHSHLYVMNALGVLYDITPAGFTAGLADAQLNTGFGGGAFGAGTFGTPRADVGNYQPASVWMLDNWGRYLISCMAGDGHCYRWQNNTATPAAIIPGSPSACLGILATQDRFVFALGASGDGRMIAWCDQDNDSDWSPSSTNQAGDIMLNTNGRIVTATELRSGTLILTDIDAHVGRYIGLPYVYGFETVGTGCGTQATGAIVNVGDWAMWWGRAGFWRYDGAVTPVDCPIRDLLDNLNVTQISKISGFHNVRYSELWWFYPSSASTENDSYVSFNYRNGEWNEGKLARLCGAAPGVFKYPLAISADGYVYEHEVGTAYDGAAPLLRSGPIEIGDASRLMRVTGIVADQGSTRDAQVKFYTRLYPSSLESETASVVLTDRGREDLRFTAREAEIEAEFLNANARLGTLRLEASVAGLR